MSQKLPLRNFKWLVNPKAFDPSVVDADGDTGYILEVDLDYPVNLHDAHNDYPLAPEKVNITEDMLSPYTVELADKLGRKITDVSIRYLCFCIKCYCWYFEIFY